MTVLSTPKELREWKLETSFLNDFAKIEIMLCFDKKEQIEADDLSCFFWQAHEKFQSVPSYLQCSRLDFLRFKKPHILALISYIKKNKTTLFFSKLVLNIDTVIFKTPRALAEERGLLTEKDEADVLDKETRDALRREKVPEDYYPLDTIIDADCLRDLLEALSHSSLQELYFEGPGASQAFEILQRDFPPEVHYFIDFPELRDTEKYRMYLQAILPLIQSNNLARLSDSHLEQIAIKEEEEETKDPIVRQAKKIKLKELIWDRTSSAGASYIKFEVQHIEQAQHIQQTEVVTIMEEQHFEEMQEQHVQYNGSLVGYEKFIKMCDIKNEFEKQQIRSELFANLPHAIKFLSRTAADVMSFINWRLLFSLNARNLPENFILKKTDRGELVLDYDLYAPGKKSNAYTPVVEVYREKDSFTFTFDRIPDAILCQWNGQIGPYYLQKPLDSLWARYGEKGIEWFFKGLKACNDAHPGIEGFLFFHYFQHFPHWDHFLDKKIILDCLEKIMNYDSDQLACLKKFLQHTGSSQHNLKMTLISFDVFWVEWTQMCKKHSIDISRIHTATWTTPIGGNPVVYMERLLALLKKARDLKEQVDYLDDILLDNYGPHYAMTEEDFQVVVSKKMRLNYVPDEQDKIPFNPHRQVYRVDLERIQYELWSHLEDTWGHVHPRPQAEDSKEEDCSRPAWAEDSFYEAVYRFIGQQRQGISLQAYQAELEKYEKNLGSHLEPIFVSLFFVAHERYSRKTDLYEVFRLSTQLNMSSLINQLILHLSQAYFSGIFLNAQEGITILNSFFSLNSNEFYHFFYLQLPRAERRQLVRSTIIPHYMKKLFFHLSHNKHSTLKLLKKLSSTNSQPFIFSLDTAELLGEEAIVAQVYRDELLLFSNLINSQENEYFYEYRADEHAGDIKEKIEQVRNYLKQAASSPKPNNLDYAFKIIVYSAQDFSYSDFLKVFNEISKINKFDPNIVQHLLKENGFNIFAELPAFSLRESENLKIILISFIRYLSDLKNHEVQLEELTKLNITELKEKLTREWFSGGISALNQVQFQSLLHTLKQCTIEQEFSCLENSSFTEILKNKILTLRSFQGSISFENLPSIAQESKSLAEAFLCIISRENFQYHEREGKFTQLLDNIDFSLLEFDTLFPLLLLLKEMPSRNYLGILITFFSKKKIISDKEKCLILLRIIKILHSSSFSSKYIEKIIALADKNNLDKIDRLREFIIPAFAKNNNDTLLHWIITDATIDIDTRLTLAQITQSSENYRDLIKKLISKLNIEELKLFLAEIRRFSPENQIKILEIIVRSAAISSKNTQANYKIDYANLVRKISSLGDDKFNTLYIFFEKTTVNIACLNDALKKYEPLHSFADFLSRLEKSPFGDRSLEEQFDITQIERIVNGLYDITHNKPYSYTYRKQVMEAFLFVNAAGKNLPLYRDKPAIDLSNPEIQELFLAIKSNSQEFSHLDLFQRRLYALGLMREAIFRSTGEFPYPMQMISLIDCMMHKGDVLSNIDTGQGKSLVEAMKAGLLWLTSDRVSVPTQAIIDAKRDIEIYSPFFTLLGIAHAKLPITSTSPFDTYQAKGINYGTVPQFVLFDARAIAEGVQIGDPNDCLSLVINESDHTVLDDNAIDRYAISQGVGIANEWIYTAINDFILTCGPFRFGDTFDYQDIALLKKHLFDYAKKHNKSDKIIHKFNDEQFIKWIESAILVNYKLRKNIDYVVSTEPEEKVINGEKISTPLVKILKDFRPTPDLRYGNGMHQLLCAKLNQENGEDTDTFFIDPESKTIISLNKRAMLDCYRLRPNGFIWGSSGTTAGNQDEIDYQYLSYGFELSKVEPHQKKQVTEEKPIITKDEDEQFDAIINQIRQNHQRPALIFLKDIETANRFFKKLKAEFPHREEHIQLYTGVEDEKTIIQKAAGPHMLTVTTPALGRNTNILYDRTKRYDVYRGFIDTSRKTAQQAGRIGRQGSEGTVYTILNQKDFPHLSIEEKQRELEEIAKRTREFNDELYALIGYFLRHIKNQLTDRKQSRDFFTKKWPSFSDKLEALYYHLKQDNLYDQDEFIEKAITEFNNFKENKKPLSAEEIKRFLNYKYPLSEEKSLPDDLVSVTINDCTLPEVIAYHFLNQDSKKDSQRFLSTLLKEQIALSESSVIRRWVRSQGYLNAMLSNPRHIFKLSTMQTTSRESKEEDNEQEYKEELNDNLHLIKSAVTTLLEEYLQYSWWFVSHNKKEITKKLQRDVKNAQDIQSIIALLQEAKISTVKADIQENKKRKIKSVNMTGSRLQSTLTRSLILMTALGYEPINEELMQKLHEQTTECKKQEDPYNEAVLAESISMAKKLDTRRPVGMIGRLNLFPNLPIYYETQQNKKDPPSPLSPKASLES
ncbi:MAG: hypothetical protein K0S27_748 [Gammaproteobacteria bacterium]|jgi:hypothetical protein|nr:hypothetical protein [Gammaproteobacteria bacterium]